METLNIKVTKGVGALEIQMDTREGSRSAMDMVRLITHALPRLMISVSDSLTKEGKDEKSGKVLRNAAIVRLANNIIDMSEMTDEEFDEATAFLESDDDTCACGKCHKKEKAAETTDNSQEPANTEEGGESTEPVSS